MDDLKYGILAPNIRQQLFKMFELHQIIRQREGNHSKEDMKFKEQILQPSSTDYPIGVSHLFIQNAKVNELNDRAHH